VTVIYFYEPSELEGGKKRANDRILSVNAHKIYNITRSTGILVIYRSDSTAPQRGFTREQLQVISENTNYRHDHLTSTSESATVKTDQHHIFSCMTKTVIFSICGKLSRIFIRILS